MSITFPTFIDKEIVSPEKLNDFVQALEAKFAAGLTSSEIQWPLTAAGDLEMGDNAIVGGKSIWDIQNAAQYDDDWDTCLVDGTNGCIVIPPDTTVLMDGAVMGGTSLTIKGSGPTSILRLEAGATAGFALRNSTTNFCLNLQDLTLDGQDIASQRGIILQGAKDVIITGCTFKDFGAACLQLIKLTSACRSIRITNNRFEGGAGYHIEGSACSDLVIADNVFDTAAVTAIDLVANSATALMKNIGVDNNVFSGCTDDVIRIHGNGTSPAAYQEVIGVHGNMANGSNGMKIGSASARLLYVSVSDNVMPGSTGNGLTVGAQYGTINDNVMPNASADGLDLLDSQDLVVRGNNFHSASGTGIVFLDAEDCLISDNDCRDCTGNAIVISDSVTNPCRHYNNDADDLPESGTVQTWYSNGRTLDIPANTLKVGDTLTFHALWTNDSVGTQRFDFGPNALSSTMSGAGGGGQVTVLITLFVSGATTAHTLILRCEDGVDTDSAGPNFTGYDWTTTNTVSIVGETTSTPQIFATVGRGVSV